ncbi:OprO/OprP family phosphate-selective porin [Thiohalorhabdus sp.]|uniref:OprO/OprP family phosphate-selective porin n=1 Tax=Thiohalorhabdus sp. TaxID=3094134 RepID=UPI002FC315A0
MGAKKNLVTPLLLATAGCGLCATAQAANGSLEERVGALENRLEEAEGDQQPWNKYVDEFGGRIMYDETFRSDSDDDLADAVAGPGNKLEEGSEFRRLRLYAEGSVAANIAYKVQLGLAGSTVDAKSVYIKAHDLGPWPDIKIGHFKEPISLQELTSSKYISLMSRTMLTDFFSNGRSAGIQLSDSYLDERLNISVGAFKADFDGSDKETNDPDKGQSYNITGRITSPVFYANDGRQVLHLGVGARQSTSNNGDSLGIGLEPEVHKTNDFVAGTLNSVDDSQTVVAEVAGVAGPVHGQAEWAQMDVDTNSGSDPDDLTSSYVQAGWLITGETRPYDKGDGDFGRIKPANPLTGWGRGTGAWEVVARFSTLDLSGAADPSTNFTPGLTSASREEAVGETDVTTLGLNWYPTAHSKWMLNYVDADQDKLGDAQYVTSRFQVDF